MNTILSPTPNTFCACESVSLRQRRFEAFTLTELLVVIAIIGILAPLLFPVVGNRLIAENGSTDLWIE